MDLMSLPTKLKRIVMTTFIVHTYDTIQAIMQCRLCMWSHDMSALTNHVTTGRIPWPEFRSYLAWLGVI